MTITNSKSAFDAIKDVIKRDDQEELYAILLNKVNKILSIEFEALGSEDSVVFPKKIICRDALMKVASGVIIVHTHPSGNPKPSASDVAQTESLRSMLNVFEIPLLDHIIVSTDKKSYYSFSDERVSNS